MNKEQRMVQQFTEKFGLPFKNGVLDWHTVINRKPTILDQPTFDLCERLIKEELKEFREADDEEDLVLIADALGDMLYTVYWSAVVHGIDLEPVFREIHVSNMTKTRDPTVAKVIKGPHFKPPNIKEIIANQRNGELED